MRRRKRLLLACLMTAVAFVGPATGCLDSPLGPGGSGSSCGTAGQSCPCCPGYACETRIGSPFALCREPCKPGFIGCR